MNLFHQEYCHALHHAQKRFMLNLRQGDRLAIIFNNHDEESIWRVEMMPLPPFGESFTLVEWLEIINITHTDEFRMGNVYLVADGYYDGGKLSDKGDALRYYNRLQDALPVISIRLLGDYRGCPR